MSGESNLMYELIQQLVIVFTKERAGVFPHSGKRCLIWREREGYPNDSGCHWCSGDRCLSHGRIRSRRTYRISCSQGDIMFKTLGMFVCSMLFNQRFD